jgi:hypothetical protein
MTVAKVDKRVGDSETRAAALEGQMEEAAGRYLDAITPWVVERFEDAVAAAVRAAPEVTQELGAEGLAALRAGLDRLSAGAAALVRRRVGTPGAWPHLWGRSAKVAPGLYGAKAGAAKRRVEPPPFLESRLRLLLGTAGHLLARHGYERFVRQNFGRAYLRTDYHPPEYLARSVEGHEQFLPLLAAYADLCDEYAAVLAEARVAGRERAARAAADLWQRA